MVTVSTFPLFSYLPPELRAQIWRASLPTAIDGPVMHLYRKGLWRLRQLTAADEGFDPEDDDFNLAFEFRLDLLDDLRFEVPLLSVNREARDFGLAWVHEHSLELRSGRERTYPYVVRRFDPERDALYVPFDEWKTFAAEPVDRQFEPDLVNRTINVTCDLDRIAVPEALLRDSEKLAYLADLFYEFMNAKGLFVILDPQPAMPSTDAERAAPGPQLWEFEPTSDRLLLCGDDGYRLNFGHESPNSEALRRLTADAVDCLIDGLTKGVVQSFEVRTAYLKKPK